MPGLDGAFLCLGNPLLDISSKVDAAFLAKYEVPDVNDGVREHDLMRSAAATHPWPSID